MNRRGVLNLLGLAKRANLLVTGEEAVMETIRKKQAKLAFLAADAGGNTAKRIKDKTKYYEVPLLTMFTSQELSQAIGNFRMVVAFTERGFAEKVQKLIGHSPN